MEVGNIYYDTEINQYYVVAQIISDCGINGYNIKFIVFDGFKTDHKCRGTMIRKSHEIENDDAIVQVGGIY